MDVGIEIVAASPTAVVRGPLDLPDVMPRFDRVYAFIRGGSTDVRQAGQNVILYGAGSMEVGVEVDRAFEPVDGVEPSSLPGGRVAHATHTTGYGDLHRTYDAIRDWCAASGHTPTGVTWEIYGDPDDDHHVDVEVCYLLA